MSKLNYRLIPVSDSVFQKYAGEACFAGGTVEEYMGRCLGGLARSGDMCYFEREGLADELGLPIY